MSDEIMKNIIEMDDPKGRGMRNVSSEIVNNVRKAAKIAIESGDTAYPDIRIRNIIETMGLSAKDRDLTVHVAKMMLP